MQDMPYIILGDLSRALRAARERKELTQQQLASLSGLSRLTVSELERGVCKELGVRKLKRLLQVVGFDLALVPRREDESLVPDRLGREDESRLLDLCASGSVDPGSWLAAGPAFFVAGLAVMLASATGFDRAAYLSLAESLYPGSTRPETFAQWLARSPVRPARFLPLLRARMRMAA